MSENVEYMEYVSERELARMTRKIMDITYRVVVGKIIRGVACITSAVGFFMVLGSVGTSDAVTEGLIEATYTDGQLFMMCFIGLVICALSLFVADRMTRFINRNYRILRKIRKLTY